MGRTGKRKWAWLAGIVLAGMALAVGIGLLWPHEKRLMDVARPILALDRWTAQGHQKEEDLWLPGMKLLILTTDHDGRSDTNPPSGHADLFDISTHTRTRLNGLTKLLNKPDISPWGHDHTLEVSPDGTWLQWVALTQLGRGGEPIFDPVIAKLDGSEYRHVRYYGDRPMVVPTPYLPPFWIDEQHLVGVERERGWGISGLTVFDAHNPKNDHTYPTSSEQARTIWKQYYQAQPIYLRVEDDYETGHRSLAMYDAQNDDTTGWECKSLSTDPIPLEDGVHFWGWDSNRQQSAIVLHLTVEKPPPFQVWLHRFLPSISVKPIVTEGLWVIRADGKGRREIGHVLGEIDAKFGRVVNIYDIRWLPDGKQISFVYQKMLYVVPAEMKKLR